MTAKQVLLTVLPLKASARSRKVGRRVLRGPAPAAHLQEPDALVDDVVRLPRDPESEARAEEFEQQCRTEATLQFKCLKDEAQAIYGLTRGRVGVRSREKWAELLEKACDEIGNGRFIVRCLGRRTVFGSRDRGGVGHPQAEPHRGTTAPDSGRHYDDRCRHCRLFQHAARFRAGSATSA